MSTIKLFIICASSSEPLGGMENHIISVCQELAQEHQFRIVLAAAPALINACKDRVDSKNQNHIRFTELPCTLSRRNPKLMHALYKQLKNEAPDLVHCHGYKALQLAKTVMSLAKGSNVFAGDPHTRPSPKKLITTVHGTKSKPDILRSVDHVICVSHTIQSSLAQHGIKSALIENGIPRYEGHSLTKKEICSRHGLDPSKPLALSLGRLAEVKNFALLMNAFQNIEANLLILGDGPEYDTLNTLQNKSCILGGHRHDAQAYLKGCDCLIISSLREGLSLSMVEALQASTPVLSSPVSGALGLLPDACLLDITDIETLEQNLKHCLNQLDRLKQLSIPAFSYAKTHLTQDAMSTRLTQVYRELCHEPV
jgi:glycosyltransferase involved in cell wall biosynthesis